MRHELGVLVVLVSCLAACGGVVRAGGAGGTAGAGAGGAGGSGGAEGIGGGGSGGGLGCDQTNDRAAVKLAPESGPAVVCVLNQPTVWEATGAIVQSDASSFQLNTCPPNADCMQLVNVDFDAPGLALQIPSGTFVRVKYELMPTWGSCTERLTVTNVATWAGLDNPVATQELVWLVSNEGLVEAAPEVGLEVSALPLGCVHESGCGPVPPDSYALEFTPSAGDSTVVGMGQTATVSMGSQALKVRNLRSFQPFSCDNDWNWGWWATNESPVD